MADTAFTVKLASTGQEIPIAADQTVLDALHSAGLNVPISCGQDLWHVFDAGCGRDS